MTFSIPLFSSEFSLTRKLALNTKDIVSAFLKKRSVSSWASCYSPLPPVPAIPYHIVQSGAYSSTPCSVQEPTPFRVDRDELARSIGLEGPLSPMSVDDYEDDQDSEMRSVCSTPSVYNVPPPIFVIDTEYNPELLQNKEASYLKGGKERDRYRATQKARKEAKNAEVPESLDDLSEKVRLSSNILYILILRICLAQM